MLPKMDCPTNLPERGRQYRKEAAMNIVANHPVQYRSRLEALGFVSHDDERVFRLNGMVLKPAPRWCTLETARSQADPASSSLGEPGLWRNSAAADGLREFHLPFAALGPGGLDEDGTETLRLCVEWAMATARGTLPAGWTCPPRECVEKWIPDGGLTIESGPLVRQGELVSEPGRLAFRFAIVPWVAAGLPAVRSRWLDRLIASAHKHWRMVRVGWRGTAERRAIEAEVDLSGAPHEVLEQLTPVAIDALHWVAQWLLLPAQILSDVRVQSPLFDCFSERGIPRKGDV